MKRILPIIVAGLLMAGCGNSEKEQAKKLLQEAYEKFGHGQIDEARACIDSLRKTFPNIVEARKGALILAITEFDARRETRAEDVRR